MTTFSRPGRPARRAALGALTAAVIITLAGAPGASSVETLAGVGSDPALVGEWSAPFQIGVRAVHSVVLPTGKVLLFAYPGTSVGSDARLWDPSTANITDVSLTRPRDIHCSGHSFLADGRLFLSGGELYGGGSGEATIENDFFDPATGAFSPAAPLVSARWYPTTVELADGRVLIFGGFPDTVEVYDPGSDATTQLPASATKEVGEYPRLHLLPNGKIAYTNFEFTELFDPGTSSWTTVAQTKLGTRGESASSVLLPGLNRVLLFGGTAPGGMPTATAEIIDLSQPTPSWRYTSSMTYRRQYANAVVLADGTVLAVGGGQDRYRYKGPIFQAELFDPDTETWTLMAAQTAPRIYHSTAVLLPDGRVLSAGQDRFTTYSTTAEIYSPPYLFKGPRPTIGAAPSSIGYGETFSVSTPDASSIGRIALISPGSVTHSVNFDQRYVQLSFTATDAGTLSVTSPRGGNHAPPGWYMLVILDSWGVPSVASWVRVAGAPPPPPPPDETPPMVALSTPADGSSTTDTTPNFSGMAGTAAGDSATVTVHVFAGTGTGGTLVQTQTATRGSGGTYSVDASSPLALGTYTARAEQSDGAGNTGFSSANTFTITEPPPDTTSPAVALTTPADGSSTTDTTPSFSGTAGTAQGDSSLVVVEVFAGAGTGGTLLQTLFATPAGDGSYSIDASSPLAPGTYTAQAHQSDAAGNTGFSSANTFTITEPPPATGAYNPAVLSDAPFSYWRLGETTGTTSGDEMGVAPGVYEAGVSLGAAGALTADANTAAHFDGSDDRVNMGDPPSLDFGTRDITVELWLKTTSNSEKTAAAKMTTGAGWLITVTDDSGSTGLPRAKLSDGAVSRQAYGPTGRRVDDGAWHHVVAVFDRDVGITLYVDGVPRTTGVTAPGSVDNDIPLRIGKTSGYGYFLGEIDEVAIYDKALSAERVQAHYNAAISG